VGIGSGISLFIAAGVAEQIFTGTVNWEAQDPKYPVGFSSGEGGRPTSRRAPSPGDLRHGPPVTST